jgi:hypothetical protein
LRAGGFGTAAESGCAGICLGGSGSGAAAVSGSDPSTKSWVCEATGVEAIWRVAIMPCRTSRIRERAVSGERKISTSSAVAATADRR